LAEFFEKTQWYHVLDFDGGLASLGNFDYRNITEKFGFPARLDGKRALDVGAADGFFSFEMERRGASVLAVDTNKFDGSVNFSPSVAASEHYTKKYINYHAQLAEFPDVFTSAGVPVGHRFLLAKTLKRAAAEYRNGSIYNLDELGEKFDVIFCGALIEHLKNPIEAVEQLRGALKPDGLCVISLSSVLEAKITSSLVVRLLRRLGFTALPADRGLTYNGHVSGGSFFHFFPETFRQLLLASGFRDVRIHDQFKVRNNVFKQVEVLNNHVIYHCRP
jgi:2-polyprenyl-3-methyl-5-hydroxy-6-metoxy-1,4-benzoquinol methylase